MKFKKGDYLECVIKTSYDSCVQMGDIVCFEKYHTELDGMIKLYGINVVWVNDVGWDDTYNMKCRFKKISKERVNKILKSKKFVLRKL